jgi:hypothetical protein
VLSARARTFGHSEPIFCSDSSPTGGTIGPLSARAAERDAVD